MLRESGIDPELLSDEEPGVVEGTWEVRVAPGDVPAAEAIARSREAVRAANPEVAEGGEEDPSHELDLVTVEITDGSTAEMQAIAIQSILQAEGIQSVIIGSSTMPNLGYEVRVSAEDLDRARQTLLDAKAAGPAAAAEAEQASESIH
jgi:hypothetical protein